MEHGMVKEHVEVLRVSFEEVQGIWYPYKR
jgi:hypothetical protein